MDNLNKKRPSIRDLKINRTHESRSNTREHASTERSEPRERPLRRQRSDADPQKIKHSAHKRGFKFGWWVLAIVLLIAASIISLPVVFSDTTITIKPVVTRAAFTDALFNAFKKDAESTETTEALQYMIVEWDAQGSETLEPTGREQVKEKASGVITVYNDYTTNRQRLIKNTRFEDATGHVYRVRESIMVPGKTASGPGSLDVRVYADEAGKGYNITGGNLSLPGLKSIKNMYTDIYAKVKTPIAGGFNGERAVVNESSKQEASKTLRAQITSTIKKEVQSRIPEDTRYFEGGVSIDFADTSESEVAGKVEIRESASVKVIVFNKKVFADVLALGVAGNPHKGYPVIRDVSDLDVSIDMEAADSIEAESIKIIINGDADFVWHFDTDKLIADLAGKERQIFQTVLTGYPTIADGTEAIIRPFWKSTFPKNAHDFTIKIADVE